MYKQILIRILVIFLAILTMYVFYIYLFKPYFLESVCFLDTKRAVKLIYWKYKKSILINMLPTNFWIWYNNDKIYVYGSSRGYLCDDADNYVPAWTIDIEKRTISSLQCITKLEKIQKYYKDNNIEGQYYFYRPKKNQNMDVWEVLKVIQENDLFIFTNPISNN